MKSLVAFDIDGVIRDVSGSYRRALMDTVEHFGGWRPTMAQIDDLKAEGCWNNDWLASQELLRRHGTGRLPDFETLVGYFQDRYLGDPPGSGYLADEPLLVAKRHFEALTAASHAWGFFSGASRYSALHVLQQRLRLASPPLVAMGEAPEKPDPTGLLLLADSMGSPFERVYYLGDTVADMQTVVRAMPLRPEIDFIAIGVLPPHVLGTDRAPAYAQQLQAAGARCVWETIPTPEALVEALSR